MAGRDTSPFMATVRQGLQRDVGLHRNVVSDEEDGKSLSTFYQFPVQSTASKDENIPGKMVQVVGSIPPRNSSAVDQPSTQSIIGSSSIVFQTPESGSMKSVTRLRPSSPVSECLESESTPLLQNHNNDTVAKDTAINDDPVNESTRQPRSLLRRCCFGGWLSLAVLFIVTVAVVVPIAFEFRLLKDSENIAVLRNEKDTIIVAQVNSKQTSKVSLQLVDESSQHLHVMHLYSSACDKLSSHVSTTVSSALFPINDDAIQILLPTYFVRGSLIEVNNYVLNTSSITVDIELYIFYSLDMAYDFANNLDKSVFQATIYISKPGVQNTSTFVNYTVPSTGYYFIVVAADAYIVAQFDITLHRQLYNYTDYKVSCTIEDNDKCVLSYDISFQDEQECILAHAATYIHDAVWPPAYMQVTIHSRRNTAIAILVMSLTGGMCVLFLFVLICGFYCVCKCSLCKPAHYKSFPDHTSQ